MASIAFIVGNSGSLNASFETAFKDRLEVTLGHTCTVIDDSAAETTDFSGYAIIWSSMLCAPTAIDGLKTTVKPMMFGEQLVTDDYGFGDSGSDRSPEQIHNIVDNTHYITSPFSTGNITIYTSGTNTKYFENWANDVNCLMDLGGAHTDKCSLAEIDKGETLADASTAADRRVWWGPYKGSDLDTDGWTLFDRSIAWLLAGIAAPTIHILQCAHAAL